MEDLDYQERNQASTPLLAKSATETTPEIKKLWRAKEKIGFS